MSNHILREGYHYYGRHQGAQWIKQMFTLFPFSRIVPAFGKSLDCDTVYMKGVRDEGFNHRQTL
jgi:hypothetical protein